MDFSAAAVPGNHRTMRHNNSVLTARGIGKTVKSGANDLVILREIDLAVTQGEAVAVVGASGSGKSTLLAILAGLDTPSTGSVELDGVALEGLDEDARARLRAMKVGFVFQSFQLLASLSALGMALAVGKSPRMAAIACAVVGALLVVGVPSGLFTLRNVKNWYGYYSKYEAWNAFSRVSAFGHSGTAAQTLPLKKPDTEYPNSPGAMFLDLVPQPLHGLVNVRTGRAEHALRVRDCEPHARQGPEQHGRRRQRDHLAARERDQLVDRAASDAERHAGHRNRYRRRDRQSIERLVAARRRVEIEHVPGRHEQILR